ncbi:MAG: nickel-dependent lactate racemase [Synergistaceae bacterium]|jgi:nickel-dependent lactate racemase|nr:nickel-dependent lactate racemase [Synergistaceae bacterium]
MKTLPALGDLKGAIISSLENPIGLPPLRELVNDREKILFLVEDATRATPLDVIMPVVVNYLNSCDVPDGKMSFLTAPGTHRLMTDGEIEAKLGREITSRFNIFQHDAAAADELADMGTVMAGDYPVPVRVNKKVLEADFVFGLGNIVPHSDAGFSGGAKILQPGVCGFATTGAIHAASAFCPDIPLGMPENPCRAGMDAVAAKAGLSFILNVVKNFDGEVCGVFAGDFVHAHRKGVEMAVESFKVPMPRRADVVVVSSYPADIDYWQAEKGISAAYFAVREGGIIILAAPCAEGLATNHPRFREWLAMPLDEVRENIKKYAPDDEEADLVSAVVAACNCRARDRADIFSVTDGLCAEDIKALRYTPFDSVQAALGEALRRIPNAAIGILPQGGVSLPVLEKI